jgi:uncharacterized protein YdeI (YjbR/CyaY-like superfamily)
MEKIPPNLNKALAASPKAKATWVSLTPIGRRDFISWIEGAKKEETRKRRVEVAISKLLSGERRPCCYAVVPMNLYRALGEDLKAKATWKTLTPDERRDFSAWVEEGKDQEDKNDRVEEVCEMLVAGKKRP